MKNRFKETPLDIGTGSRTQIARQKKRPGFVYVGLRAKIGRSGHCRNASGQALPQ